MARFLVLLGLALLTIAEVAAVLALYNGIGPAGTVLVLGLDMVVGVLVMRSAAARPGQPDRGWRIAGGAIIALPGLVLDLVGLAMLIPATRAILKRVLARNVAAAASRSGMTVITVTGPDGAPATAVVPGDVIVGEVVDLGPEDPAPGSAAPSPQPPRVIRGEIAGPAPSAPPDPQDP